MISRVVIDTNAYSALFAGSRIVADVLARSESIILSAVVVGEILDGFFGGKKLRENYRQLNQFRQKPRKIFVSITDDTAERYALIKQQLRKKGKPIPLNDIWIAACCMEHGAALLSFDSHFHYIDGLSQYLDD